MATILHITERAAWEHANSVGHYTAPSLVAEGFIHCSTPRQALDTANHFYKGQRGLVVLCIDEAKLSSRIEYEPPSTPGVHAREAGQLFPHIYGNVNLEAVTHVVDFPPNADGTFELPAALQRLLR